MSLGEPDQARRGRRDLQVAPRRLAPRAQPRTLDRDPAAARLGHRHGVRRARADPSTARGGQAAAMARSMRWAARSRDAFDGGGEHAAKARRSSASSRARSTRGCARDSAAALIEIGFDGYAIGGLAVGEGQEAMFGCLDFAPGQLPADTPALPDGRRQARPTSSARSSAGSTCSIACCRRARAAPGRRSRATARSTSATRGSPRITRRSTPTARCPVCATGEPRLSAPSRPQRRNPRRDADDRAQYLVLPGADGRPARRDRGGAARTPSPPPSSRATAARDLDSAAAAGSRAHGPRHAPRAPPKRS